MATNPNGAAPRLFTSPPRLRSVPALKPEAESELGPAIPTSLFNFPDTEEPEGEEIAASPPSIAKPSTVAPPNQSPGSGVVSLFHPRHFAPEFDLLHEITANRAAYVCADSSRWLSLRNLPVYVRVALERIRERVPCDTRGSSTPSLAVTVSAAASHGLSVIREHEAIIVLLELYHRFQTATTFDIQDLDELSAFFHKFHTNIVDGSASGLSSQLNIRFPPNLRVDTEDFSSRTGISMSVLVTLGCMVTLSTQPDDYVLPDHRELLDQAVEAFFRRANRRVKMARVVLEMMGSTE